MLYRDVARLIAEVKAGEAYTKETEVFVDAKSVVRSEFYSSLQSGTVLSMAFLVRAADFELATEKLTTGKKIKPTKILYDGSIYLIRRAYSKDGETLELNCSGPGG